MQRSLFVGRRSGALQGVDLCAKLSDYGRPVISRCLSKQPRLRIPWTIASVELPSPVRHERQSNPYGLPKRSRQMRHSRVYADDEVKASDQRSGLSERGEPRGNIAQHPALIEQREGRSITVADVPLQGEEIRIGI
jgi:hypothetical protein